MDCKTATPRLGLDRRQNGVRLAGGASFASVHYLYHCRGRVRKELLGAHLVVLRWRGGICESLPAFVFTAMSAIIMVIVSGSRTTGYKHASWDSGMQKDCCFAYVRRRPEFPRRLRHSFSQKVGIIICKPSTVFRASEYFSVMQHFKDRGREASAVIFARRCNRD